MTIDERILARPVVPRISVGPGPLQYFQMASLRGTYVCALIPLATVGSGPLQHMQMTTVRRMQLNSMDNRLPLPTVIYGDDRLWLHSCM